MPRAGFLVQAAGAGSTGAEGFHVALDRTGEQLARTANLVLRVANHLVKLGDPADGAGQRKNRSEQRYRNANGALHDTGVEVDVGVELALDEVVVFQCNFF